MNEDAAQKLLERVITVERVQDELIAMGVDKDDTLALAEEIQDYIVFSDENYQFIRMLMSDVETELDDDETEYEDGEEEEWP